MLKALLQTLRPKQWFKNVFVAVPLVFAQRLLDGPSALRTVAAMALFSLLSGCVYVLNDLLDVEQDKIHPHKRNRPIPSGRLPTWAAWSFLAVAAPGGIALGWWLAPRFGAVLASYFALNVAYSLYLKQIPFLDVLLIAGFFILRVLAGAYAIDAPPSPWLIVCTFLLATFLAIGKRAHELASSPEAGRQRSVLRRYDLATLRWTMRALAVLTAVVYLAYTRSPHTVQTFGTTALIWTTPFPVFGILRFIHLVTDRHQAESPTEEMLKDIPFMANLGLYTLVVALILYLS